MTDIKIKRFQQHTWQAGWEALTEAEQADYLRRVDEALAAAGGKRLVLIVCDSAYALQQWNTFGLEILPDQAAVEKHADLLKQIGWTQMVQTETINGTGGDLENWLSVTLSE